jgi:hypothetical protein
VVLKDTMNVSIFAEPGTHSAPRRRLKMISSPRKTETAASIELIQTFLSRAAAADGTRHRRPAERSSTSSE